MALLGLRSSSSQSAATSAHCSRSQLSVVIGHCTTLKGTVAAARPRVQQLQQRRSMYCAATAQEAQNTPGAAPLDLTGFVAASAPAGGRAASCGWEPFCGLACMYCAAQKQQHVQHESCSCVAQHKLPWRGDKKTLSKTQSLNRQHDILHAHMLAQRALSAWHAQQAVPTGIGPLPTTHHIRKPAHPCAPQASSSS